MGDGRAEGSSAIGDGGQTEISLTPDVDGTHVRIFEGSQLDISCIGDLMYITNFVFVTVFYLKSICF